MATPRSIEVHVSLKQTKETPNEAVKFRSTEYSYSVTLDLERDDVPEAVIDNWTERLRESIRLQFDRAKRAGRNGSGEQPEKVTLSVA